MSLRVVQVNCVIDAAGRGPEALLDGWPTLPAVAEATAEAGAEVTVLQASRTAAETRRNGVAYRFVAEPRLRGSAGPGMLPRRLVHALRGERADVIHFNGFDFPFHARAITALGIPMLVQDHASRPGSGIGRLRRWGYGRIAAAAFTAVEQAEPFLAARQLPSDLPLFAIPESSSCFTPGDREAARARTGVFGAPALLWVGRLDANKDPLTIVEAFRQAARLLPDAQLWCAFGADTLLPEVERRLARQPELAGRVHLLGRVPHAQIEWLCRACDLYVSASRREGSGYALIEAMACGLIPVVSDIAPFRALTGGVIGALAPAGDAEAFAAAIVAQAKQPRVFARAAVARHFHDTLAFDKVGERLVSAYAAVAEAGARQ